MCNKFMAMKSEALMTATVMIFRSWTRVLLIVTLAPFCHFFFVPHRPDIDIANGTKC